MQIITRENYAITIKKEVKPMKKYIVAIAMLLSFVLISCATASGTVILTGTKRDEISSESVSIYTEYPSNFETIGIVSASSDAGMTEQQCLDYTIAELKKQAAKVGANGIIIDSINTTTEGFVMVYNVAVPVAAKTISAKAIYVEE